MRTEFAQLNKVKRKRNAQPDRTNTDKRPGSVLVTSQPTGRRPNQRTATPNMHHSFVPATTSSVPTPLRPTGTRAKQTASMN